MRLASHTIPIKRELKGFTSVAIAGPNSAASHTIPIKRELKGLDADPNKPDDLRLHTPSR